MKCWKLKISLVISRKWELCIKKIKIKPKKAKNTSAVDCGSHELKKTCGAKMAGKPTIFPNPHGDAVTVSVTGLWGPLPSCISNRNNCFRGICILKRGPFVVL